MILECSECNNVRWTLPAIHCPNCHNTFKDFSSCELHFGEDEENIWCYLPAPLKFSYTRDQNTGEPVWASTLSREEIEKMTEPASQDLGTANEETVTGSFYPENSEVTEEVFHAVPLTEDEVEVVDAASQPADKPANDTKAAEEAGTDSPAAIRAWAVENGHPELKGKRGRLPKAVLTAYAER